MTRFIDFILAGDHTSFRADFTAFARRIATHGIYNSLAQLALKIGAPGVPDFYQGTEVWDFSLVDPDNRRPVDYTRRQALLAELDETAGRDGRGAVAARLAAGPFDDRLKLYATTAMLRFRRNEPAIFETGSYRPLATGGVHAHRLFAFARIAGGGQAVVAVPRLTASFDLDWRDSWIELPPGEFENVFTGQSVSPSPAGPGGLLMVRAADLFGQFPIAALRGR
jgi:(1->4)-alpha-D-glucan 1-alpha-D-glucosylmutase